MTSKTHQTAVVLIPPEDIWEPIQSIRRRYDRQVRRWMPHITLLYPFVPRERFDGVESSLREACSRIRAFVVRLDRFRHFDHGRGKYTLWLGPEPKEPVARVQRALQDIVPGCDDVSRHPGGFTPHLSVGQVRGADTLMELEVSLQDSWSSTGGLSFPVRCIYLITRESPPNDIFRVDRSIPLGG